MFHSPCLFVFVLTNSNQLSVNLSARSAPASGGRRKGRLGASSARRGGLSKRPIASLHACSHSRPSEYTALKPALLKDHGRERYVRPASSKAIDVIQVGKLIKYIVKVLLAHIPDT